MTMRACILWLGLLGACASRRPGRRATSRQPTVDPRVELARKIPGTHAGGAACLPIPGMYELVRGTDIAYVTSDGKYAISGDLYDLATNDNLTEVRRRDIRMKLLATVPESDMVIFGPQDPKYTVTVFTDVDCAVLPQAAQSDRRVQPSRHPRALHVLSALRAQHRVLDQGGAGLVLGEPQRCADPRQTRRGAEGPKSLRQLAGGRGTTRWARSSISAARRPSS